MAEPKLYPTQDKYPNLIRGGGPRSVSINDLNASFEGDYLVIRVPLRKPRRSRGGKGPNVLIASTEGNVYASGLRYDGKPVIIGLNAFTPADDDGSPQGPEQVQPPTGGDGDLIDVEFSSEPKINSEWGHTVGDSAVELQNPDNPDSQEIIYTEVVPWQDRFKRAHEIMGNRNPGTEAPPMTHPADPTRFANHIQVDIDPDNPDNARLRVWFSPPSS